MSTCTGPACDRAAVARGLCGSHLKQAQRGRPLAPLRAGPALERLSLRVPADVRAAALEDPDGAREALTRWAKRAR